MTSDSIQFTCTCGRRLGARIDQAGRIYRCPGCGVPVQVPTPAPATVPESTVAGASAAAEPAPVSLGDLYLYVLGGWAILAFVCLLAMFAGGVVQYLALAALAAGTVLAFQQIASLLGGRQTALRRGEASLLFGAVRMIAWEPTQGVLILRNKALTFKDDDLHDGRGGVRLIYPVSGDELALRVPLETQTLTFDLANVLTQESLALRIRGSVKWRIADIERFYLLTSRELRVPGDTGRTGDAQTMTDRLLTASIGWLRGLIEEQTRTTVSRVRSGLLLADRVAADLPEMRALHGQTSAEPLGGGTEGLASAIHATLTDRLREFGLAIVDVSLQEVGMPASVVAQCEAAARSAYLPTIAAREARARRLHLQADAAVIGRDAVAAREVVKHAPAYALGDFLDRVVAGRAGGQTPAELTTPESVPTIDVSTLAELDEQSP